MKKLIYALGFSLLVAGCGGNGGGGGDGGAPGTGPAATTNLSAIDNSCIAGGTMNQSVCNNTVYNQYQGWSAYPNVNLQNYYQNGVYRFCGCPAGTVPVYGSGMGLGCVQYNIVPANAYQWNLGAGYNWAFAQASFNQSSYYTNYRQNYWGNYNRSYDPRPYGSGGCSQRGYNGLGGYYYNGAWYNTNGGVYAPSSNNSVNLPQVSGTTNVYNCSNSNVLQSCFVNQANNTCGNGAQCIATNGSVIGICSNPTSGTNGSITGGTR